MKSESSLGYLCEENGFFCPFMKWGGICIATSCKRIWDIYERNETEKWAREQKLIEHEKLRIKEQLMERRNLPDAH